MFCLIKSIRFPKQWLTHEDDEQIEFEIHTADTLIGFVDLLSMYTPFKDHLHIIAPILANRTLVDNSELTTFAFTIDFAKNPVGFYQQWNFDLIKIK
jgi:hypothetical protein